MRRFLADSLILLGAYFLAFLLRFDFHTPTWGWHAVSCGFGSAFLLGWAGLLLFRCHQLPARAILLRNLPLFVYAVTFMMGCQLILRLLFVHESYAIYLRPPIGVIVMAGVLELLGLLALRYIQRLQLRPIEVADLLGRVETEIGSPRVLEALRGKVVLITGAGGSLGGELARQALRAHPKRLILLDMSEAALYQIHTALTELPSDTQLIPIVANCAHRERMHAILTAEQPDFLFHAASYKHVPMMERNVSEAISNNALTTRMLAEEALACGIGTFLLLSTDKASSPDSAMAISMRLAEIFLCDLAEQHKTRFCAVRFGNVLASSGSVVEKFRRQIANGGPVTVTDAQMKRRFITLSEASGLILQASTYAKGGEVFCLDMGEEVTILSLAETMISLSGLRPHKDIPIIFTGMRPGEKTTEAAKGPQRELIPTAHPRLFTVLQPSRPHDFAERLLRQCTDLTRQGAALSIEQLQTCLSEKGKEYHECL